MSSNIENQTSSFVNIEIDIKTEPLNDTEEFHTEKLVSNALVYQHNMEKMEILEPIVNIEFVAVKVEDIKDHYKGKNILEYNSTDFDPGKCSSIKQVYKAPISNIGEDMSPEHNGTISQDQYFNEEKYNQTVTKRYKCSVCDKSFYWKTELDRHFIIHTDKRPFACEICNKSFRLKHHLSTHMISHNMDKPYICDICQKKFSYKNALNGHKLIHSGEKPHACDQCNLRFRQKCDLVKHKRVHSGEKPFECDVCHRAFTNKSQLIRHRRIHTGEKPYACDICNKPFTHLSSLSKHKQAHIHNCHLPLNVKLENS